MPSGEDAVHEPISSSGQLFATYLVSLRPDGLVLVDQHAAHERVLFERTLELLDKGSMQKLLHPLHLDLSSAEVEILEELLPELEKSGVEIQRFGARSFRLTGMPLELTEQGAADFVRGLIERVRTGETTPSVPDFRRHIAAVIACHGSVRANQKLGPEEARSLLRDLFRTGDPAHCPHGRPTFIRLEREEIEKRFKRT
jgi:DNA mismatch repair protein MutL